MIPCNGPKPASPRHAYVLLFVPPDVGRRRAPSSLLNNIPVPIVQLNKGQHRSIDSTSTSLSHPIELNLRSSIVATRQPYPGQRQTVASDQPNRVNSLVRTCGESRTPCAIFETWPTESRVELGCSRPASRRGSTNGATNHVFLLQGVSSAWSDHEPSIEVPE